MSVNRHNRERRDQRVAYLWPKFDQHPIATRYGIEGADHAFQLAAGRRVDIEVLERGRPISEHVELSHAGLVGRGFLEMQGNPVASPRHRHMIRECTFPETVVEPGILAGHRNPLRHRRIRGVDASAIASPEISVRAVALPRIRYIPGQTAGFDS